MLADRGAVVVDADELAREALAPGTEGLARVVEEFGPDVLAADGSLDRAGLGRIVFADAERLQALNAIVHPYVGRRSRELMAEAPDDAIVVYDVALLVENALQQGFDVVVVVEAEEETRVRRVVEGRGTPEADVRARMAVQATPEARRAVAQVVIENDGDLRELSAVVDKVWTELLNRR